VRVYLDTNVLVSAFATRGLCADVFRHVLTEHDLLTGEVNLTELRRVLRRRFRVPVPTVAAIEELLRAQEIIPKPRKPFSVPVRDPDDVWVLASAIAGKADVLVTGDNDLLELSGKVPIRILDARGFWQLLRRKHRSS
jgi:putative PIN family toxin of toxin-antitoxin system